MLTSRMSCTAAKGIVSRLSFKPVPQTSFYPGTYSKLKCYGGPLPAKLPETLACGKPHGGVGLSAVQGL